MTLKAPDFVGNFYQRKYGFSKFLMLHMYTCTKSLFVSCVLHAYICTILKKIFFESLFYNLYSLGQWLFRANRVIFLSLNKVLIFHYKMGYLQLPLLILVRFHCKQMLRSIYTAHASTKNVNNWVFGK